MGLQRRARFQQWTSVAAETVPVLADPACPARSWCPLAHPIEGHGNVGEEGEDSNADLPPPISFVVTVSQLCCTTIFQPRRSGDQLPAGILDIPRKGLLLSQ